MGNEIWVALGLIFFTAASIITPLYLRYLQRIKELETLVKLSEGGHEVKLDLLTLLQPVRPPRNDARRGLIFLAVGIPLTAAMVFDGSYVMAILIGGMPLLIGAAFLLMARMDAARASD